VVAAAPIRLWSWNLNGAWQLRHEVIDFLTSADVDVVLAQEVRSSVASAGLTVIPEPGPAWKTALHGDYQTAILHRTSGVRVEASPRLAPLESARWDEFGLSTMGTASAATIHLDGVDPIVVISVYCPWDGPGLGWQRGSGLMVSEANAHRIVSDISMLSTVIDQPEEHRVIVAGDWNILRGYGEGGSPYWGRRYGSVFERMGGLGFTFCGPEAPDGGVQADPWPSELPVDSRCVPTFHHSRSSPAAAARQLDFVFASTSIAPAIRTRALNRPEEWGPSDHCRVEIELSPTLC
jgi:exonuclease III